MARVVNQQLLRDTMDAILAHPDEHNQNTWQHVFYDSTGSCRTTYCFAGWACVLSGVAMRKLRPGEAESCTADGRRIPDVAQRLLGLDKLTAHELFHGMPRVEDLKHAVDEICEQGYLPTDRGAW